MAGTCRNQIFSKTLSSRERLKYEMHQYFKIKLERNEFEAIMCVKKIKD